MAKRKTAKRAKRPTPPRRATTIEDQIAERREALKLEPRTGTVPPWFIQILKNKYPEPKPHGMANRAVLDETLKLYGMRVDWAERVGSSKMPDGRVCFVAEPYDSVDVRRQFETLCKNLGLEFAIFDESSHNPGRTIRLAAVKPG